MAAANKELVRRHFEELFDRKNLAVTEELLAEEYVEHAVEPFGRAEPGRGQRPGRRATVRRVVPGGVPRRAHEDRGDHRRGDTVAVRVFSEATGKRFAARQSHWFRVEDDKLAEHWATREDLPVTGGQEPHMPEARNGRRSDPVTVTEDPAANHAARK
jgi:ketosteroid isomerase-like protein